MAQGARCVTSDAPEKRRLPRDFMPWPGKGALPGSTNISARRVGTVMESNTKSKSRKEEDKLSKEEKALLYQFGEKKRRQ